VLWGSKNSLVSVTIRELPHSGVEACDQTSVRIAIVPLHCRRERSICSLAMKVSQIAAPSGDCPHLSAAPEGQSSSRRLFQISVGWVDRPVMIEQHSRTPAVMVETNHT